MINTMVNLLAIVTRAVMNMDGHVSLWQEIDSFGKMPRSVLERAVQAAGVGGGVGESSMALPS